MMRIISGDLAESAAAATNAASNGASFIYAPLSSRAFEAAIAVMTVAPFLAVAYGFHGIARVLFVIGLVSLAVVSAVRGFRVALIATDDEITIKNYWRTRRFPWSRVKGVATAAILTRPAIGFVLDDGTVWSAEATQMGRGARDEVRAGLRRLAPPGVRFLGEAPSRRMGVCPRCGEKMLAPAVDSGIRHCWSCGGDFPANA